MTHGSSTSSKAQLAIEGSSNLPGGEGAFPQPTALSKALIVAGIADDRNMVEITGSDTPEERKEAAFVMFRNHEDADGIHFTKSVLLAFGTIIDHPE